MSESDIPPNKKSLVLLQRKNLERLKEAIYFTYENIEYAYLLEEIGGELICLILFWEAVGVSGALLQVSYIAH